MHKPDHFCQRFNDGKAVVAGLNRVFSYGSLNDAKKTVWHLLTDALFLKILFDCVVVAQEIQKQRERLPVRFNALFTGAFYLGQVLIKILK